MHLVSRCAKAVTVFIAALSPVVLPAADAPARRPNVLFIFTDDQSHRTAGCYRDEGAWPWVRTPNLDRLASEGTRFSYAYGASWCTPSRACVLTGLLPHGIRGMNMTGIMGGSYDPPVRRFWPATLRSSGYETAMIGKWHISHDSGHGRDWDHSVVWDQADIKGDWYNDQLLSIDGAPKKMVPGYSTDVYTGYADEFIRKRHEKPWLMWLCYNAPHLPLTTHPRHSDLYRGAEVKTPSDVFGPRAGTPRWQEMYTQWKPGVSGADRPLYSGKPLDETVRGYNRLVATLDEGIGRLLASLEQTGQLDNTLIIFASDQGFAWGEHGFAWKVGPYDACLRIPMIFRLPGRVARNAVCRQPVTVVDLAPTILGFTGVEQPWPMHGRDLRPLLENPATSWERDVAMEHFQWQYGPQTDRGLTGKDSTRGIPWWIFLRHGNLKYVRTLEPDEIEELYDLEADPEEHKNLALDPTHEKQLRDLRGRMEAELKRTDAGLLKNLPPPRTASAP